MCPSVSVCLFNETPGIQIVSGKEVTLWSTKNERRRVLVIATCPSTYKVCKDWKKGKSICCKLSNTHNSYTVRDHKERFVWKVANVKRLSRLISHFLNRLKKDIQRLCFWRAMSRLQKLPQSTCIKELCSGEGSRRLFLDASLALPRELLLDKRF